MIVHKQRERALTPTVISGDLSWEEEYDYEYYYEEGQDDDDEENLGTSNQNIEGTRDDSKDDIEGPKKKYRIDDRPPPGQRLQ